MEKHLVDFKGGRSQVWNHFGFWQVGSEMLKNKAVCKLCKAEYVYNANTTTLRNHLLQKHPNASLTADKSATNSQPTIRSCLTPSENPGPLPSQKQEDYTKSLCEFLIEDTKPISTVEGTGFIRMINTFAPR